MCCFMSELRLFSCHYLSWLAFRLGHFIGYTATHVQVLFRYYFGSSYHLINQVYFEVMYERKCFDIHLVHNTRFIHKCQ